MSVHLKPCAAVLQLLASVLLLPPSGPAAAVIPPQAKAAPALRLPTLVTVQLGAGLTAQMLSVALDHGELSVLSTAHQLHESRSADASLQGLGRALAARNPAGLVLLSGGFNRQDPLDPIGVLIDNRRSFSPLSLATKKGSYRFSGVLCVGNSRTVSIETVDSYQQSRGACRWALQAGPLVVERGGAQAISDTEGAADKRLIACEPANGGRSFEFYFFEQARLIDVERALKPRCSVALNLAGSVQAGMLVLPGSGQPSQQAGQIDTPLPSVILIQPR